METTRRFSAEITFAGLCVVHFQECRRRLKDESGPRQAGKVEVLLAEAHGHNDPSHRHLPRLNYYLQDDLAPRLGESLRPSPDGQDIVSIDLTDCDVEITPPFPYPKSHPVSELTWMEGGLQRKAGSRRGRRGTRKTRVKLPRDPYEDKFLDWILNTEDFRLDELPPDRRTTVVKVPNGQWSCAGVIRNREVGSMQPLQWQLVDTAGKAVGELRRALGTDIRLRLDGLRYGPMIAIKPRQGGPERQIQLTAGTDGPLRLSITNLPEEVGSPDERHLPMYAPESELLSIRQVDQLSCRPRRPCDASVQFSK